MKSMFVIKRIVLIIFVLNSFPVFAQQKQRLNSGWEFLKQDLGGIWEAVRSVGKGNPESVPLWEKVNLPHCFNADDAVDPNKNYYQGPGWYRTQLDLKNPYKNGRILLHFEGAGQKTEIYVYDKKVDEHVGGYDEWTVDITDAVEKFKKTEIFNKQFNGKVPVSIRCDNSRDLEMIPSDLSDFNVYGGIYRYLNLIYTPPVFIDKLFAKASVDKEGKKGFLNIKARFANPLSLKEADVSIRVFDPSGKKIASYNKKVNNLNVDTEIRNFEINKPKLWSTEKPQLYTVEVDLISSSATYTHKEKVGFRNFEFIQKGPFHLNGSRLLLRGTHRHEDHAGVAAAMTEEMITTEMKMMKEMGVNFIRLGHYQQSRIVLDLCDSLGILVWEEIPWCRGGLGGEIYQKQAKRMLTNMIEQHYNHSSIIIWGLGNENDWPGDFPEFDKQKIRTFMKELNDLSHQLDISRKTAIRRCDFCADIVDVYSPSIWAGWYRGIYTDYKTTSKAEFEKVNHFLHVEWGGDSHAGRHAESPDKILSNIKRGVGADERAGDASLFGGSARVSKDGDWSESYICNLIDWHLKEQETMPWLTGTAYWPFKDFSTPVRPDNPVPYMNQKGVVERDFNKKESYYVFQSYWTDKPMAHIYGHSWPIRWGDAGEEKMIKVFSNCDEAELFVNGKSYGIKKRNSQDFPAAGLRWMVTYHSGENIIKVIAKKGREIVTDEIKQIYQTAKWGKPVNILVSKIKEENNLITLQVNLKDAAGNDCLDAINWINFDLTGDGVLLENLGTSSGSSKVQAYNGRAIIKINTIEGKSVVSIKVDGLPTAFLSI